MELLLGHIITILVKKNVKKAEVFLGMQKTMAELQMSHSLVAHLVLR